MTGIEGERVAIGRLRRFEVAGQSKGVAKRVVGLGRPGAKCERPARGGHRVGGAAGGGERAAQVDVGLGEGGGERERPLEGGDRLVHTVRRLQRVTQVDVGGREPRVPGERPLDEWDRALGVARLVGEDAEEVEGVGMVGVRQEDPAIELLGLGRPSGLMGREGLCEDAIHSGPGALGLCGGSPFLAVHRFPVWTMDASILLCGNRARPARVSRAR